MSLQALCLGKVDDGSNLGILSLDTQDVVNLVNVFFQVVGGGVLDVLDPGDELVQDGGGGAGSLLGLLGDGVVVLVGLAEQGGDYGDGYGGDGDASGD